MTQTAYAGRWSSARWTGVRACPVRRASQYTTNPQDTRAPGAGQNEPDRRAETPPRRARATLRGRPGRTSYQPPGDVAFARTPAPKSTGSGPLGRNSTPRPPSKMRPMSYGQRGTSVPVGSLETAVRSSRGAPGTADPGLGRARRGVRDTQQAPQAALHRRRRARHGRGRHRRGHGRGLGERRRRGEQADLLAAGDRRDRRARPAPRRRSRRPAHRPRWTRRTSSPARPRTRPRSARRSSSPAPS